LFLNIFEQVRQKYEFPVIGGVGAATDITLWEKRDRSGSTLDFNPPFASAVRKYEIRQSQGTQRMGAPTAFLGT
jgi:hypothetical protein